MEEVLEEDNTFSELLDTMSVEYAENLDGIITEFSDMSMSMPAEMGTDVDNERLETLLFEHDQHWPGYDHDAKCLYLRKILKFILKYPHHDKSGILGKKIGYLIEYKCNKVETTTTVSNFHIMLSSISYVI